MPETLPVIPEKNINAGEFFLMGGGVYRATKNIPRGIEAVPHINCEETEIADVFNEIFHRMGE